MNNKGVLLIGVIIIIVLLAVITVGITTYITEGLMLNVSNINREKAMYMAQAGVMAAISDYKVGGAWSEAENENIEGEFYYHIGEDANFLWVDASNPAVSGKFLKRIPIKNIHDTDSITITDMVVSWSFGGNITQVYLGSSLVWSSSATSPATIDITDFNISSGTLHSGAGDQQWKFSKNITSGFDVTVTFIFSDGSSRKAILSKNQKAGNSEFSIKSTGEVRSGSSVDSRRTLVATYDLAEDEITSWEESQDHIIP